MVTSRPARPTACGRPTPRRPGSKATASCASACRCSRPGTTTTTARTTPVPIFPTRIRRRRCSSTSGTSLRTIRGEGGMASMMPGLTGRTACACRSSCSIPGASARRSAARRRARSAPGPTRPTPTRPRPCSAQAQWAWLGEQLRQPAELRLIVSSVQVLAEGHGYEHWGNLPRERQRLLELLASTRANGVILLSGDRHVGALYRLDRRVPYPLYEITSSGLNMFYAGGERARSAPTGRGLRPRELRHDRRRLVGGRGPACGARAERRARCARSWCPLKTLSAD